MIQIYLNTGALRFSDTHLTDWLWQMLPSLHVIIINRLTNLINRSIVGIVCAACLPSLVDWLISSLVIGFTTVILNYNFIRTCLLLIAQREQVDLNVSINTKKGRVNRRESRACMERLMNTEEVKEVCFDRTKWRAVVSAYPAPVGYRYW